MKDIRPIDFFDFHKAAKKKKTLVYVASANAAIAMEQFCVINKLSCLSTRWLNSDVLLAAFNTECTEHGLVAVSVLPRLVTGCRFNADMIVWGTAIPERRDVSAKFDYPTFVQAMGRGLRPDVTHVHMPIEG